PPTGRDSGARAPRQTPVRKGHLEAAGSAPRPRPRAAPSPRSRPPSPRSRAPPPSSLVFSWFLDRIPRAAVPDRMGPMETSDQDLEFMTAALEQAEKSYREGGLPIGAVMVEA